MQEFNGKRSCDEWMLKAKSDLKSAKKLKNDEETWDNSVYLAQQCAEKSFKAFLDYCNLPIARTHDLELLVGLCSKIDTHFELLKQRAAFLKPFSIAFRYPDDLLFPAEEDVIEAIDDAQFIFNFIQQKIKP